ncbi:histidinol phosphate phosphatase H [Sarocladium strictum]
MAFTMHSHSGQFCPGHAKDNLEDIIRHAISIGYKTMGLTEHMPRYEECDLYPEERDDPKALEVLPSRHESYLIEAQRLQKDYASQIHLLIGFETDFIRPNFTSHVQFLASPPVIDYFIGSLHHVHGIPIDYDAAMYASAVAASSKNGTEEGLYEDYYDEHLVMLEGLKPKVVGHFDLVRLLSKEPGRDVREWKGVWERIIRNLKVVKEQGGWLECNTAALRKGLAEPYPCRAIAEEWVKMGGKFTMSDDSHGIAQVATNYGRGIEYLASLGVEEVWTLKRTPHPGLEGEEKAQLEDVRVPIEVFKQQFKVT